MKAVIVNCFDTYEIRADLVREFFKGQGFDVTVIQSDFEHSGKIRRKNPKTGHIFVHSKPYYKNFSFSRLISHYIFSRDAFKIVEDIEPDYLYVLAPPNSLVKFAAAYKRKHERIKLIIDIIDLWPENMPIEKIKKMPPFTFWAAMRDKNLKYADMVITECNLYQDKLGDVLEGIKCETVHLAKKGINTVSNPKLSEKEIHLAYLGSINNVIDIPGIKQIIQNIVLVKPVTLHIIGYGEKKQELIEEITSSGAIVEYHDKIFDAKKKQQIFDQCHFGLNIMKDSVCVGLTMKSIDYFQHGLPIINNIKADSEDVVREYGAGINIDLKRIPESMQYILHMSSEEMTTMRNGALNAYEELFSSSYFFRKLEKIIKL